MSIYPTHQYKGLTGSLKAICKEVNADYNLVFNRMKRGASIEQAIETPLQTTQQYTYKGFTGTLGEICSKFDKDYFLVSKRMRDCNWGIEKAIETPVNRS